MLFVPSYRNRKKKFTTLGYLYITASLLQFLWWAGLGFYWYELFLRIFDVLFEGGLLENILGGLALITLIAVAATNAFAFLIGCKLVSLGRTLPLQMMLIDNPIHDRDHLLGWALVAVILLALYAVPYLHGSDESVVLQWTVIMGLVMWAYNVLAITYYENR